MAGFSSKVRNQIEVLAPTPQASPNTILPPVSAPSSRREGPPWTTASPTHSWNAATTPHSGLLSVISTAFLAGRARLFCFFIFYLPTGSSQLVFSHHLEMRSLTVSGIPFLLCYTNTPIRKARSNHKVNRLSKNWTLIESDNLDLNSGCTGGRYLRSSACTHHLNQKAGQRKPRAGDQFGDESSLACFHCADFRSLNDRSH